MSTKLFDVPSRLFTHLLLSVTGAPELQLQPAETFEQAAANFIAIGRAQGCDNATLQLASAPETHEMLLVFLTVLGSSVQKRLFEERR